MKILDPGHKYALEQLDEEGDHKTLIGLHFVKREGEKYPGNIGHYPGTTSQEVIRVLIDRQKYVDQQIRWAHNEVVINDLRHALIALETRAAEAAGITTWVGNPDIPFEDWPICKQCGHLQAWCNGSRHE